MGHVRRYRRLLGMANRPPRHRTHLLGIGMSNKFGWVIGGALAASLLAYYGFQANVSPNRRRPARHRLLMALAPAAGTLLAGLGMFFYRLNETTMQKIQAELAVVRAR